jgi:CRISPR-associated protein Cmr1
MKKLEYQVSFNTPAFLGNAEQQAQWRTPPFKALIRQWWRVAYAADRGFRVDVAEMRREEGMLFGHAWLEDDHDDRGRKVAARKSLVRIRLDQWEKGRLKSWNGLEQPAVFHPEVQRTNYKVGPHAYLGYGPLDGRGNTKLSEKINAAIQAGESATLSLAVPEQQAPRIERALWLMDRYGTLGGRSRNGWGSFSLAPLNGTRVLTGELPLRFWREALDLDTGGLDWPHALGQDEKGVALVWQTQSLPDWKALMRELAIIKIGLRTQFVFPNVRPPHQNVEARHWLSYPITTHTTRVWNRNARLPNNLRFKVRRDPQHEKKLVGVIFHVPCLPPGEFHPDQDAIVRTWQSAHALLDELTAPVRSRTYGSIGNASRRAALKTLKTQLDTVNLTRIVE